MGLVFLLSVAGSDYGDQQARAMFSYIFAYEVVLSIALGALGWVMIEHVTRSGWSVVVRRIGETTMATLPLFALLWLPIAFGTHTLYPWTHEATDVILDRKRWFLNEGFFFGRAAFYFLVWSVLSWWLYSTSLKRDEVGSDHAQRDALTRKLWAISAPGIILWGLTQSFQAIDWLKSLQPHWYSTIFGVYFFAGSILAFFCFMTLVTMGMQRAGVLRTAVTTEHFHDLGKFVFGYTIFWAYIAFSQFMLIWYANLPEETEFYMVRLAGGWEWVSYALPILHFGVPFLFLLSRHVKRNRAALAGAAGWMLFMHMVDLHWLVIPNFGAHSGGHHEPHLSVSWLDFAALATVGGIFLAVFGWLLARNKVLTVHDPRLPESLAHENY